jgi:site-specific recombinase XerD
MSRRRPLLLGSDIDLWQREITVRGKGGKDRIGQQAARSLDRYLRARSRHRRRTSRSYGSGPATGRR